MLQDEQNELNVQQEQYRNSLQEYGSQQKQLNEEIHGRKEQLRVNLPKVKKYEQESAKILGQLDSQVS